MGRYENKNPEYMTVREVREFSRFANKILTYHTIYRYANLGAFVSTTVDHNGSMLRLIEKKSFEKWLKAYRNRKGKSLHHRAGKIHIETALDALVDHRYLATIECLQRAINSIQQELEREAAE
jgi:hypothetical protein